MKIGLIVDGQAEVVALPALFPALQASTGHEFLRPRRATMHPLATPARIAHACGKDVAFLQRQGAQSIVVMLDLEQRSRCPVTLASAIRDALRPTTEVALSVVVKDPMFQNWLVADPNAFGRHPKRFQISDVDARSVSQNNADNADARSIIERSIRRGRTTGTYTKTKDSLLLLSAADPATLAENSRSFRRFLRCVGHPDFRDQSRSPHRG